MCYQANLTNQTAATMFETSEVNPEKLPRHIAVIMDGNGRWAAARGLPRILGHRAGADAVHRIVEACCEVGVQALTLYAFSWENWSRPSEEIRDLMELLDEFLTHEVERLRVNQIRLRAIGRLTTLPPEVLAHLNRLMASTSRFSRMTLTLALSYGGRQEIVDAVRRIAQEVQEGRVRPEHIDERLFHEYLYLPELPDPDLLIRTSGEQRVSNFLLWQASYSELYVTPQLWPDFGKEDLLEAIVAYQKRERRFGATVQAASSKPQASGRKLQTTEEGDKSLRPPDCPEAWSLKPVAYLKPGA